MDAKLLSQLCEVIAQGSLSRAALSLKVTQPTLTRNMKAIEEVVGAPVLRRGRYGVTPTSLGERLSKHGEIINGAMTMADETVNHWRTGLVGEVRLGVVTMLCTSVMPGFFAANPMKESNFTVRLIAGDATDLMTKLRTHDIDMIMVPSYTNSVADKVTQESLFETRLCVLAGSRSPLINSPGKINTQLLRKQVWISINNMTAIWHSVTCAARQLDIEDIVPKFRFDGDITTPMALLRDSDMLAIAPYQFAKTQLEVGGVHILNIDAEFPMQDVVLKVSKANENDTGVAELSRMLKNYFSKTDTMNEPVMNTERELHAMDLS